MHAVLREIKLLQKERLVHLDFTTKKFALSCEYLRVFSPSAEVRGHGGETKLVLNKENINIIAIEPVGNYAVKLIFDDGHNTGIYSFNYLYDLGEHLETNWAQYQSRLKAQKP